MHLFIYDHNQDQLKVSSGGEQALNRGQFNKNRENFQPISTNGGGVLRQNTVAPQCNFSEDLQLSIWGPFDPGHIAKGVKMPEVEKRKSARIIKLAEQRANKKKNIGATTTTSQANANANANRKKKPKRKRLSEVSNAPIPLPQKTQHQQGEERPGNENPQAGGSEPKNLGLPLPENDELKFVIDVLQCKDKFDIFGQPVNPKEVEHYDTYIKEPMDFGTIRAKLQEGIYKNLNEFEYDVFLVPNNAMMFNDSKTIYFKEAEDIKNLAMRVFNKLKTDPNGLKDKFSSKISKKGRKPREEAGSSSTKRGTNSKRRVGGSNDQIGSGDANIERRRTYMPSTRNDSILSMVYNGPKQLIPGTSGINYKESLKRFVKDLGPTAHKVAAQKLARCLTKQQPQRPTHPFVQQQPQMPTRSFMQQRLQMPTHSFMQQRPQVPIGPKMGQRPQAPTQSFMGSNPLIPIRPYNAGIVKGRQAPSVPCDPITMLDDNEQLGSQRADKGKGIFINDDIDISIGTLKNALSGYNNDVFANTRDGNSVLGADPKGKSVVTDGRVPSCGFFERMLNLENDAGDDIDRYPCGGISAQLGDIAAFQNALQEERTSVSNRDVMAARPNEKGDMLPHVLKNQLSSTPNTDFDQGFNLSTARPTYPIPPARPAIGPNLSLLEFVSRQNNRPRPSVHPSRVVTPSRLSMIAPMNPSFQASSAELNQLPGWNPPVPWGSQQVKEVIALGMGAAPPEFTRPSPYGQDIMRRLELQQQQPVPAPRVHPLVRDSRKPRQTASTSLPARLASPLDLLGALSPQEPQHVSTVHGQQGDTVPVGLGARPQQGPQDNAGPSGQLAHQELQRAPDPRVGRSGSNPVDQAVRQEKELEQALPANYRYFPQTFSRRKRHGNLVGQDQVGPEGLGAVAPQEGQQQEAGTNDPNLLNYRQQYPDLVLQLGAKPPPSL